MGQHDEPPYVFIERRGGGIGSFLLGALVGAGLGILFAPRSGEETREELREGAARLGRQAEDTLRQVRGAVGETVDEMRHGINEKVEAAREAFESGRVAARETREEMERRVREARERVRAGIDAARRPPEPGEGLTPGTPEAAAGPESKFGV